MDPKTPLGKMYHQVLKVSMMASMIPLESARPMVLHSGGLTASESKLVQTWVNLKDSQMLLETKYHQTLTVSKMASMNLLVTLRPMVLHLERLWVLNAHWDLLMVQWNLWEQLCHPILMVGLMVTETMLVVQWAQLMDLSISWETKYHRISMAAMMVPMNLLVTPKSMEEHSVVLWVGHSCWELLKELETASETSYHQASMAGLMVTETVLVRQRVQQMDPVMM
mmetsp:Transcript_2183/g.5120  ORF Transcript_2183/g.5120 Transcript_2183/m.5120 type:complete len:224 (+) Transcript_2183:554-1225(+)